MAFPDIIEMIQFSSVCSGNTDASESFNQEWYEIRHNKQVDSIQYCILMNINAVSLIC